MVNIVFLWLVIKYWFIFCIERGYWEYCYSNWFKGFIFFSEVLIVLGWVNVMLYDDVVKKWVVSGII